MKKPVRVYISGTVQGLFFRQFVKDSAEKLNVKGFVRNLEDGRVEAFFEGNVDNVNAVIEICRRGPPHAQIRKLEVKDEKYQGFSSFKILNI